MKTAFIIKPTRSSIRNNRFKAALERFRDPHQRGAVHEYYTAETGDSTAGALAAKAVRTGCRRIVLAGGDGIVNQGLNGIMAAVDGTAPSDLLVGVVPTGTGNDFAWALGIPVSIEAAFSILKTGREKKIDIGRINGRFFFNSVSFGADADINRRAESLKGIHRLLPDKSGYLLAALQELCHGPPRYRVTISGKAMNRDGPLAMLAVTNGPRYGGMFKINPRARVDDGFLDICYVKPLGRWRALQVIARTMKGRHGNLSGVGFCRTDSELSVTSAVPLSCAVDGENLEPRRTYTVGICPAAITVVVPPG